MCLGYGFNRYSSSKPTWQKRLDACQKIFRHLRHQSHRIMIVTLSKLKIRSELIIVNLPGNDFILLILANREYGIFSIVSHSTVWIVPCMVSLRLRKSFQKGTNYCFAIPANQKPEFKASFQNWFCTVDEPDIKN